MASAGECGANISKNLGIFLTHVTPLWPCFKQYILDLKSFSEIKASHFELEAS